MDFNQHRPIYLQMVDFFCEQILAKKWKNGTKIPSIRAISAELEVNPNTAIRAFNFLQEKEIIYNKRGIGYFVSENGAEKTKIYKKNVFIEKQLPLFFKQLDLLDINIAELADFYQKNKKNTSND